MPTVRARVECPDEERIFYQPPKVDGEASPGRRLSNGSEFDLYYDDDRPLYDGEVNGKPVKGQKGRYMVLLEEPKKKPGPKPKVAQHGD